MQTINDRIRIVVEKYYEGKIFTAAKDMNIPTNTLRNMIGLENKEGVAVQDPKISLVKKVIEATQVSADWLIWGIGDPNGRKLAMTDEEDSHPAPVVNDTYNINIGRGAGPRVHEEPSRRSFLSDIQINQLVEQNYSAMRQNEALLSSIKTILEQNTILLDQNRTIMASITDAASTPASAFNPSSASVLASPMPAIVRDDSSLTDSLSSPDAPSADA